MKASDLRDKTDEELIQMEQEFKKKLMDLRFQLAMGRLTDTNQIKQVKRDIARIKTILRERELGIRR
ncbi:MAG: large subunit ribosomal protein [Thermotogota bacterium]|nr:large subunit ribosomal protein [Thermotogota bacterium]MDK2864133.1 large subunit ribosomal protein [Thermotogota bacterium]HCZ05693.1 50S ribosomal protein L29 [Thermotogota bacterium]